MVRDYSPCTVTVSKTSVGGIIIGCHSISCLSWSSFNFSTLLSVLSHIYSPFAVAVGEKQVHIKRSFNLNFLFFFHNCDPRTFRIPCRRSLPQYNNTTFIFAPGGVTFNSLCYKTAVCLDIFILRQRETIIAHFAFRIISLAIFICVAKLR